MIAIRRFALALLTVSMLFCCLGAPAATALEDQTAITTYAVNFDSTDLPNGATYDITIDATTYTVTAITGPDKTINVAPGTVVNFSFSEYARVDGTTRHQRYTYSGSPITVNSDMNVGVSYYFVQYLLTFDQAGLPAGTSYDLNTTYELALHPMIAGTPYSDWYFQGSWLNIGYQTPVFTALGAYNFGSLNVTLNEFHDYEVQGPATIIGTSERMYRATSPARYSAT